MSINKKLIAQRVVKVNALRSNLVYYKDTVCLSELELMEIDMKIDQCNRIFTRLADRVRAAQIADR